MWQIIGAGAIGCLWAANLLRVGQKVHLITRKKSTTQQLTYQNLQGEKINYNCPISTQLSDSNNPILVCVKASQVAAALQQQRDYIGAQQVIILMHNGMGCADIIADMFPHNPIVCASTANACLLHSPFNSQQTGSGATYLGPFNAQAKVFSHLTEPLNNALGNCYWHTDIEQKLWLKLMINVAINPLSALFQINNGELAQAKFQADIEKIINEAMPLLDKLDLGFNKRALHQTINNVITATANNYSSMNRDIHFQRSTENDYINGYLLQKASHYQIEMPLIDSLYKQIKVLEDRLLTPLNTG